MSPKQETINCVTGRLSVYGDSLVLFTDNSTKPALVSSMSASRIDARNPKQVLIWTEDDFLYVVNCQVDLVLNLPGSPGGTEVAVDAYALAPAVADMWPNGIALDVDVQGQTWSVRGNNGTGVPDPNSTFMQTAQGGRIITNVYLTAPPWFFIALDDKGDYLWGFKEFNFGAGYSMSATVNPTNKVETGLVNLATALTNTATNTPAALSTPIFAVCIEGGWIDMSYQSGYRIRQMFRGKLTTINTDLTGNTAWVVTSGIGATENYTLYASAPAMFARFIGLGGGPWSIDIYGQGMILINSVASGNFLLNGGWSMVALDAAQILGNYHYIFTKNGEFFIFMCPDLPGVTVIP